MSYFTCKVQYCASNENLLENGYNSIVYSSLIETVDMQAPSGNLGSDCFVVSWHLIVLPCCCIVKDGTVQ